MRTVIRYRNGVLNGKGASLLDGYIEDLATDRIYRLMIAQRLRQPAGPGDGRRETRVAYAGAAWTAASGLADKLLSCLFIAIAAWAGNQILPKALHLYGRFLYLLSIFVALPWQKSSVVVEQQAGVCLDRGRV